MSGRSLKTYSVALPHPALRGQLPPEGKAQLLLRPAVGAAHRLVPALEPRGALFLGDGGGKLAIHGPVLQHILSGLPVADSQPAR